MMCLSCKELEDSDFVLALQRDFPSPGGHSRTVGGAATPAACNTVWHTPRRSVRRYSFLPCISTSTSCSARRSRLISAHSSLSPCFSSRISSSFRSTNARITAEHVPADGVVNLVIDRTGLQQTLGRTEYRFHHPQLLVLQRHIRGVKRGVGAKHPHTVEALLVCKLGLVNREVLLPCGLQITSIALVAHQALVTIFQLLFQRLHDGRPIGGILSSLIFVVTDDVTLAF